MVYLLLRRWKSIQYQKDYPRCQLRALLKKASRSDAKAYLGLITPYMDLVQEYLYLSGCQSASQRKEATLKIFTDVWTRLQYTGRLSDFEHLLTCTLLQVEQRKLEYHSSLEGAVAQLSDEDRFLLVAREMENWHPRWISLACRISRRRLVLRLFKARCRLIGFSEKDLSSPSRRILHLLSRSFDEIWPDSRKKALGCTLQSHPEIYEFKGSWLEMRCKLVELRQDLRLSPQNHEDLCQNLKQRIQSTEALRPIWLHRLVNLFKFEAFPNSRISG